MRTCCSTMPTSTSPLSPSTGASDTRVPTARHDRRYDEIAALFSDSSAAVHCTRRDVRVGAEPDGAPGVFLARPNVSTWFTINHTNASIKPTPSAVHDPTHMHKSALLFIKWVQKRLIPGCAESDKHSGVMRTWHKQWQRCRHSPARSACCTDPHPRSSRFGYRNDTCDQE